MRTYFNVYPRYTAGSPSQVPRETAERVLREERQAIEWRLIGYQGRAAQQEADQKGLKGICIEHWDARRRRFERDLYTGEVFSYPWTRDSRVDRTRPQRVSC